jgi:hypothetical protein
MNEEEYVHLKRQAQIAGMGIDPFVRNLVAGVNLRPRPPDTYAKLLRELSAIGNNINQIAYWANAQKGITNTQVEDAVSLVHRAWQIVKDTL